MAEKFAYEYQAPTQEERKEINNIQQKYLLENPKNEKLKRLKSLDSKVNHIPNVIAYTMGVVGILVFGTGLTCILEWDLILIGILIMILGAAIVLPAYLVHSIISKRLKTKYREEILKLSEELLNEQK
ncbi:MAG: hypothetical protein NC310_01525 [Roseburia sp.]|nr:hypothetical protein [Anaeroplasma bactoclasticum]MCM1195734.1 hypothetical protein [Roseburia sp.]MCM1556084.1 hypothetical protein [Anaeroplasma bactoclasticum]